MARLSLVPQKREFFDLYNRAAANTVAISQQLIDLLGEFPEQEDEGDRIARAAISELFSGGVDAISLIRWKDIHEQLEEAVDACENAADVLEAILVKNR